MKVTIWLIHIASSNRSHTPPFNTFQVTSNSMHWTSPGDIINIQDLAARTRGATLKKTYRHVVSHQAIEQKKCY